MCCGEKERQQVALSTAAAVALICPRSCFIIASAAEISRLFGKWSVLFLCAAYIRDGPTEVQVAMHCR